MAYLLGTFVGLLLACLPLYLIGLLVGLFLKDKEPEERATYAAIGAWIIIYFLSAWGFADGGSLGWSAGLGYIPAAVIAFFMLRRHYRRLWQPNEDELERTFE
jgi:hypothetical protein